jgi:hypothetical protein
MPSEQSTAPLYWTQRISPRANAELVILIVLIAVSCRTIVLDLARESTLSLMGITALVIALVEGCCRVKSWRPDPEG